MADVYVPTGYTPATFHEHSGVWRKIASPDNHGTDMAAWTDTWGG